MDERIFKTKARAGVIVLARDDADAIAKPFCHAAAVDIFADFIALVKRSNRRCVVGLLLHPVSAHRRASRIVCGRRLLWTPTLADDQWKIVEQKVDLGITIRR